MKVLFVYSVDNIKEYGKPLRSWSSMQHGISYISSVLKANGHETSLVVIGSNFEKKSLDLFARAVHDFTPGLICFSSVYSQYRFIEEVARYCKERWPDRYLLAGGVHATLQPEAVIAGPFDAVCVGEGEFPVLELCNQLEAKQPPRGIANIWIKSDGNPERNETREFIQNLDGLPFPDYGMWKPWIEAPKEDVMTVFAGRGCPYDCTYCSNHAIRKVSKGRYVRTRSPEEIVKEVAFLHKNYRHREIYFEIETLDCNIAWAEELCDQLQKFNASIADPFCFGSNYRINRHTIDERLFAALGAANFTSVNIGLESGSERIRQEILRRNYSNDEFLEVAALARKHGLQVFVYNMIGLPEETLEDHKETVRLNRLCQPEGHHTGIFFPYPGTELHRSCVEQGLMDQSSIMQRERRQPVLNLPHFSKSQVRKAYTWFEYRIYKGHKPLWRILLTVALIKIDSTPFARKVFQKLLQPVWILRTVLKRT